MGGELTRKTRFLIGFLVIILVYALPLVIAIIIRDISFLALILAGFLASICILYRFTIQKVKRKYPLLPPEGKPDIYTALRIPRPIHEDMEQYPWLFKEKHREEIHRNKKVKKKH